MFFGKMIAGLFGFLMAGPIGLIIGVLIGHSFDKGLAGNLALLQPERAAEIRETFFTSVFRAMGCLAKADGRISEDEIALAEHIMVQMGLEGQARQRAIALFKEGAASDFDLAATMTSFNASCGKFANLRHTFLVYLVTVALADGEMHTAEHALLGDVANKLGYTSDQFESLLRTATAQQHFSQEQGSASARDHLAEAYEALGVGPDCSDRDLKRAYRKLMSENHPDKLIAQGVPENMVKLATERSQGIQAAYELIRKQRKLASGN